MEDIKECAELYETLLNKDYIFTLEQGIQFKLFFKKSNFHHLLGLSKLTDVENLSLNRNTAEDIYKKILKGDITSRMIENSSFYHKIKNRIVNFQNILDLLNIEKCKIIIDFDKSLLDKTNLVNTVYILYRHKNDGYVHLTLGDKGEGIYPETFFCENSKRYTSGQTLLDIVDIKILDRRKGKRSSVEVYKDILQNKSFSAG